MTTAVTRQARAWAFTKRWTPNAVATGSSVLLAALGAFTAAPLATLVAAGLGMAAQFGLLRRTQLEAGLKERLALADAAAEQARAGLKRSVDAQLEHVAGLLGFQSNERVSLFVPEAGALRLVARHSGHLEQGLGMQPRELYSPRQGCLGKAWTEGESFVTDLPDRTLEPGAWNQCQIELGITAPHSLTMRTRTYFGHRLSLEGDPVGVIVLESTSTWTSYTQSGLTRPPRITKGDMAKVVRGEMKLLCVAAEGGRVLSEAPSSSVSK